MPPYLVLLLLFSFASVLTADSSPSSASAVDTTPLENVEWIVKEEESLFGVPGVWEDPSLSRDADALQGSTCNCNQAGCACSSNLYCSATGLCYQCSQYNCNNRPSGCSCGSGLYCANTGNCQASCNCAAGWICGADGRCQHPNTCGSLQCSGYGSSIWTGTTCTCSCNLGYTGTACSQCSLAYTGYPVCRTQANCNGYSCGNRGSPYWQGSTCSCVCQPGYSGPTCSSCAPGYAGYPFCTTQPSSQACSTTTCSMKGTAVWSVSSNACICSCANGFTGLRCDSCAAGYTGYPSCVLIGVGTGSSVCTTSYCSNKGVAYWDGRQCQCTCGQGFGGLTCNVCLPGFYNYPLCLVGGSPGGVALTVVPAPTRIVSGNFDSADDDLPAGIIVLIVLIAIAVVAAGITAVILTTRKKKKKKVVHEYYVDEGYGNGGVSAPPKLAGAPEQPNPIGHVFAQPPVIGIEDRR